MFFHQGEDADSKRGQSTTQLCIFSCIFSVDSSCFHGQQHYTTYGCHEEEVSRRAWWDRSLLSGGLRTVPQLAGQQQRRWLQRGFSGQCLKTEHRLSCSTTTSQRVTPVVPLVGSARIHRRGIKQHGVADSTDPEAGGLGFSHRRMVLRPRSKYIRQRFTSLHLAVSAMFPLHTVHGEPF